MECVIEIKSESIKKEDAIKALRELIVPLKGYEMHNQAVMSCMTEIWYLPTRE